MSDDPRRVLPGLAASARVLERLPTPGGELALRQRGDPPIYELVLDGVFLMSSEDPRSERRLAEAALGGLPALSRRRPRVLIGGLGMGFTLRAALDLLPADAEVVVAELHPAVARWNTTHLAPLNAQAIADPRVALRLGEQGEVARCLAVAASGGERERFAAVLLDVDNGPGWTVRPENAALYEQAGLRELARALVDGGVAAIWSAAPDPTFLATLRAVFGAAREESIQRLRGADDVLYLVERREEGGLLAVDLGLRSGLALYGRDGRLRAYRSQNFASLPRLKKAIEQILDEPPRPARLVLEGDRRLAQIWGHAAGRRGIAVREIRPEEWRRRVLYAREQQSGAQAKRSAHKLAQRVIAWSGAKRPTSLRTDAAEAILIGLYGVLDLGWLGELPAEVRAD